MPSQVTVNIGGGSPQHHATAGEFATWLNARNLISEDIAIVANFYINTNWAYLTFSPQGTDDSHFVIMRPAPGLGVNASDTGALGYGTSGIEVTIPTAPNATGAYAFVNNGVSVQGFRINVPGTSAGDRAAVLMTKAGQGSGGNSSIHQFRHCRIKVDSQAPFIENGNSGAIGAMRDCLVITTAAASSAAVAFQSMFSPCIIERNTFVRLGGTGPAIGDSNEAKINNNVFVGCGGVAVRAYDWSNSANNIVENNFSDNSADVGRFTGANGTNGFVAYPGTNTLLASSTDFRPKTGGPLVGAGNANAISTLDVRELNRGSVPDVGAIQLAAALAMPTGSITSVTADGQTVTVSGTTGNAPTSGLATITGSNGGTTQGPTALTLGNGTFTVQWLTTTPGTYTPTVSLTNSGGTTTLNGNAVVIGGISGAPAPTVGAGGSTGGGSPTVTANASMNGTTLSASGAVSLSGDTAGGVQVYIDPQPSGTSLGPYLPNVNTTAGTWSYTRTLSTPGTYKVRAVATANALTASASSLAFKVVTVTVKRNLPKQ